MSWQRDYEWERAANRKMVAVGWPEDVPHPQAFRSGALAALVGREPILGDDGPPRWHISVQHKQRPPDWREMVRAAHDLRPGICFVIGVPPRSWWMNVHPNVLHLWELRDERLMEQWQAERQGHEPT